MEISPYSLISYVIAFGFILNKYTKLLTQSGCNLPMSCLVTCGSLLTETVIISDTI